MKTIDRIILGAIAVGLFLNVLGAVAPATANRWQDVNVAAVGGKAVDYGRLP